MKNSSKIILDLCGGTGSWSEPFRRAGYTVHVLTLPQYDVCDHVSAPDIIRFWRQDEGHKGETLDIPVSQIHGILAAPPCTMFSKARTTASTPRDYAGAMRVVRSCLDIVWTTRTHGNLKFWALENPVGFLRQFIGRPYYSFKGWEFGDQHVKNTDLWGYFNTPRATVRRKPTKFNLKRWSNPKKPARYAHLQLDRAGIRAITPPGFAKAFYTANK